MFDLSDRPAFTLTGGWVSGHTIKHLIAALAVLAMVRHLQRRRALNGMDASSAQPHPGHGFG